MTYAPVYGTVAADTLEHDQAERLTERMSRDLLRASLHGQADLGDERTIDRVLIPAGFDPEAIRRYSPSALERARHKDQRRRQLLGLTATMGDGIGAVIWLGLFYVVYCLVCPLPAHAAAMVDPDASSWLAKIVPVGFGLLPIAWALWLTLSSGPAWIGDATDEENLGEAWSWNGEDRSHTVERRNIDAQPIEPADPVREMADV